MRIALLVSLAIVLPLSFLTTPAFADDHIWTGAVDDDFFNPGNWDAGTAPVGPNELAVVDGGPQPVVIGENTGEVLLGGFQLGTSGEAGGNVVQNGGTLIISGSPVDGLPTAFEFKSHVGDQGTLSSSWIMNNDAMILYDGPLDGGGQGLGTDGINSFDLEIGAQVGVEGAFGLLELHDNAVLRISDDLKIGEEDNGNGFVLADGNSQITVGSGISASVGQLTVAQNALVVTGNSAGPGDTANGRTNEGYLTLSTDAGAIVTVTVSDEARLFARTLQQRNGETDVILSENAQFHVFDVFEFAEANFGTATVTGSANGNERTSHVSSSVGSDTHFSISGSASMSVDSDVPDSEWSGLALSGGTNRGGNAGGGFTSIQIADSGSFVVVQDLHMTLGTDPAAESILLVEGPDANIQIIGDLRMALDPGGNENPGRATIQTILTADTHSTIQVGGTVNLDNAALVVSLGDEYVPSGGESYTLISAGSLTGDFFEDFLLPVLPDELSWNFDITANDVILLVEGGTLPGDYNDDGLLTTADIDLLNQSIVSGADEAAFDLNGDGRVDLGDQSDWLSQAAANNGFAAAYLPGDTNLDGEVNATDLNAIGLSWLAEVATWTGGDLDADGVVNASDLNLLGLNWQQSLPLAAASVPEPGAFALAALALPFWFSTTRRRRFT